MRFWLGSFLALAVGLSASCASTPIEDDAGTGQAAAAGKGSDNDAGGPSGSGGKDGAETPSESPCRSALRQSLGLVDEASTASVATLSGETEERRIYVDASAGGINGQDKFPWVYVDLATGSASRLTDLEALESSSWDLAFKRYLVRTNGGDSGPGGGGALRVTLAWDDVDQTTLGDVSLPREDWFDDECNLEVDENGELITTFSGWSQYNEATHVLAPAPVVFITSGADGSLYKVMIEDYYATPSGAHGTVAGRYVVRVARLP